MSQNLVNALPETITIREYLENMLQEENISLKILEKTESKTCTYSKGPISQTIFGCKTCSPSEPSGFCFGCYLSCHLDHDTFEIGLKQNFLCECGNMNLKNECVLEPIKTREHNNKYDHNFVNKFCFCDTEYDTNNIVNEFMVSCLFCSDFYHIEHLHLSENEISVVKENDGYSIMICPKCLNNKLSFFLAYLNDPDVVLAISMENNEESNKKTAENQEENKEVCGKRKEGASCPLEKIQEIYETHEKPIFLKENWYDNLCLCEECLRRYKELDLEKIYKIRDENEIVLEDDVEVNKENVPNANEINQNKPKPLYEESLKEFSKLDFVTQSNIANLYREFYSDFIEFSKPFVERNEIITKNHISTFFEELKKKKSAESSSIEGN